MKRKIRKRSFPYHLNEIREAAEKMHRVDASYLEVFGPATNEEWDRERYVKWLNRMRDANSLIQARAKQLENEIKQELSDVWFS